LLLLGAHSIHPPSLLLNIINIFILYHRIHRKRDSVWPKFVRIAEPISFFDILKKLDDDKVFFLFFNNVLKKN
jgi:hypothetical protein